MASIRTTHLEHGNLMTEAVVEWKERTTSWTGARAAPAPDSKSSAAPIVFVVNDDLSLLESIDRVVRSTGCKTQTFRSALGFLASPTVQTPSCLVLDVAMSEVDGLDLQERLAIDQPDMPVVFVTDVADVATSVRAMKAGAVDFLVRPFRAEALMNAVGNALERSRAARERRLYTDDLRNRYASLSPRERDVMALVVVGRLNKQVGADLGISEITVKAHRGSVMRKMTADSLPDLVNMAVILGLSIPSNGRSLKVEREPVYVRSLARPWLRPASLEPAPPSVLGSSPCR